MNGVAKFVGDAAAAYAAYWHKANAMAAAEARAFADEKFIYDWMPLFSAALLSAIKMTAPVTGVIVPDDVEDLWVPKPLHRTKNGVNVLLFSCWHQTAHQSAKQMTRVLNAALKKQCAICNLPAVVAKVQLREDCQVLIAICLYEDLRAAEMHHDNTNIVI